MKLPKLPKLKHARTHTQRLPDAAKLIEEPTPLPDKVKPKSGKMEDTRPGRWFEVDHVTAWGGRCAQCGRAVPAIELERYIPPFGTRDDEIWACEDCRKHVKLSARSGGPAGRKAARIEELSPTAMIGDYKAQLEGMMGDLLSGNLPRINGMQEGNAMGWCKWPDHSVEDSIEAVFTTIGHIGNRLLKLKKEER